MTSHGQPWAHSTQISLQSLGKLTQTRNGKYQTSKLCVRDKTQPIELWMQLQTQFQWWEEQNIKKSANGGKRHPLCMIKGEKTIRQPSNSWHRGEPTSLQANNLCGKRESKPKQRDVEPFISTRVRGDEQTCDQPSGQTICYPKGTSWRVGAGMSMVVVFPASK